MLCTYPANNYTDEQRKLCRQAEYWITLSLMRCLRKCIQILPITHGFVIIGSSHITIIHSVIWYLPKQLAELLGSRLQQWKEIDKDTEVKMYRNRNSDFLQYFIITCIDVSGLVFRLSITHNAEEWRLFIDSSNIL